MRSRSVSAGAVVIRSSTRFAATADFVLLTAATAAIEHGMARKKARLRCEFADVVSEAHVCIRRCGRYRCNTSGCSTLARCCGTHAEQWFAISIKLAMDNHIARCEHKNRLSFNRLFWCCGYCYCTMVELTLLDGVVASSLLLTLGYFGATYLQSSRGASLMHSYALLISTSPLYISKLLTILMHISVFCCRCQSANLHFIAIMQNSLWPCACSPVPRTGKSWFGGSSKAGKAGS
jgi:hypothetical protein